MRINISLNEDLLKQIDVQAKKMNVSRSAYISNACSQKMQSDNFMNYLPGLVKAMNKAIELGEKR